MVKIREEHTKSTEYKLIAEVNGEFAGELEYTLFVFDTKTSIISNLEVLEKFRRQGIATQLLEVAIDRVYQRPYMHNIMLQDGSGNGVTGRIAKKFGFEKDKNGWNVWRLNRQAHSLMVKHSADNRETVGSIPTEPTKFNGG